MTTPAPERYEGPLPSTIELADADENLRQLQIMLVTMGKDARRQTPEFQELLAQYKHLGANLHLLRGLVNERQTQENKLKAQQAQMARMRDAGSLGQPRVAYRPPQAVAGASLLSKIKQLQVEQGRAPSPAAPVTTRTALQAAANAYRGTGAATPASRTAAGVGPGGAGAMRQAQLAYRPPQIMAGGAMIEKLNELKDEHPEAVIAVHGEAAEIQDQYQESAPAVKQATEGFVVDESEPDIVPEGLPLALPRFTGTMGPPYTKAIDKGPPVSNLQQLLVVIGYDVPPTGIYDNRTFRAVQELQLARCLPVTGLIGLETRKLLNEMVTG